MTGIAGRGSFKTVRWVNIDKFPLAGPDSESDERGFIHFLGSLVFLSEVKFVENF